MLEKKGVKVFEIPPALMKKLSTVETPPGILGIARPPDVPQHAEVTNFASLLLSVRDPGNMGTVIRSAEATGCEFVACSPDCAEPRQPKVVRGSMGSIFRVPSFKVRDTGEFLDELKQRGVTTYGLYPRGGTELRKTKPRYPALIILGGEGSGISDEIETDERITIPMKGKVESLNTATAATLCFYHFQRNAE